MVEVMSVAASESVRAMASRSVPAVLSAEILVEWAICMCLLTHDICLRADGNQTVDVLANRDENLSGHVTTLLRTRGLIFNVDSGSASLDEQLGQFHNSSETTMAGISIGDDGTQVVDVRQLAPLVLGGCDAFLALFPVMEQLCHEQLVYLVGDSVLRNTELARAQQSIGSRLNTSLPWGNQRDRGRVHR